MLCFLPFLGYVQIRTKLGSVFDERKGCILPLTQRNVTQKQYMLVRSFKVIHGKIKEQAFVLIGKCKGSGSCTWPINVFVVALIL